MITLLSSMLKQNQMNTIRYSVSRSQKVLKQGPFLKAFPVWGFIENNNNYIIILSSICSIMTIIITDSIDLCHTSVL